MSFIASSTDIVIQNKILNKIWKQNFTIKLHWLHVKILFFFVLKDVQT